ncbi:MAG: hypothetical protein ABIR03_02015 [Ginsengibacter sp.]
MAESSRLQIKNSIVLDSFTGRGTSAPDVLNLNKQDSVNRKFICIEVEDYTEPIPAERLKRVINVTEQQWVQAEVLIFTN